MAHTAELVLNQNHNHKSELVNHVNIDNSRIFEKSRHGPKTEVRTGNCNWRASPVWYNTPAMPTSLWDDSVIMKVW